MMVGAHRCLRLLKAGLVAAGALAGPAGGQDVAPDVAAEAGLAIVQQAKALCAEAPDSVDCFVADRRAVAIVVNAIGEAGHTRDRGQFLDLVRAYLSHDDPQLRAAAAHALANLEPDADDTARLLELLRDPIGTVRKGARVAAGRSSDTAALLAVNRFPELPARASDAPDPAPFDPAALGLALPEGAEFLWLTSESRETGELQFLTPGSAEETVAFFAGQAGRSPMALEAAREAWRDLAPRLGPMADGRVFGDPLVVPFGGDGSRPPEKVVVVFLDRLFDAPGFAVLFADHRSLVPPEPPEAEEAPLPPAQPNQADDAALDAAIVARSGFKPEAPEKESDLFMAIVAAWGYGAEDYLELYPDGAYAAEARAMLDAPRISLDALRYGEGDVPLVAFHNLPAGSSARLSVESEADGYADVGTTDVADAMAGPVPVEMPGWRGPGVHRLRADVTPPGEDEPTTVLFSDFFVEARLAALTLDKTEFAPGEAITVRFSGMSGASDDYVSVAPVGSSNTTYLSYVYTNGAREGTAALKAPAAPGAYEVRAFFHEDETILRGSAPFAVAVAGSAVAAPAATATPTAPTGDPADDARATLALDKASYAPGETITVAFLGMFGDRQDYISTAAAGAPNTSYLAYQYTAGATEGTVTLAAPTTPGAYEMRAFFREDEAILRASVPFTVEAVPDDARATLALDKDRYAPGETITVTFSGMLGAANDYINITAAGAPNTSYLAYQYTQGATEGTVTLAAPTTPGAYEMRAFFREDEAVMRASVPFVVE